MSRTFLVAGQSNANNLFAVTEDRVTAVHSAGQSETLTYGLSEAAQAHALTITVPELQSGQALYISAVSVNGVALNLAGAQVALSGGGHQSFNGRLTYGTLTLDLSGIAPRTPGANAANSPPDYSVSVKVSGQPGTAATSPNIGVSIDGAEISGRQGAFAFDNAARQYFADPGVTMIDAAVNGSVVDSAVDPTNYWWNLQTGSPGSLLLAAVADAKASAHPLDGIIWGQGEQEAYNLAGGQPRTSAARYIQATEAVFAYFRAQLGNPNLPIFIQQLGPEHLTGAAPTLAAQYNLIRASQIQVAAATPHVYIAAPTYDLQNLPGAVHFTAAGYVTIGQRLAAYVAATLGAPNLGADPQPHMTSAQFIDRHTVDVTVAGFAPADGSQAIARQFFSAADGSGAQTAQSAVWKAPGIIELSFAHDLQGSASLSYVDGTTAWYGYSPLVSTAGPIPLPLAAGQVTPVDANLIVASSGVASLPAQWFLDALPGAALSLTSVTGQGGLAAALVSGGQDIQLTTAQAGSYLLHYVTSGGPGAGVASVQIVAPGGALVGTAEPDLLIGSPGADSMSGGAGDDTYVVDNAGDQVIEAPGGGTDTVMTTLAGYTLPANVETLVFIGTGGFHGVGNAGANLIEGGAGNDTLDGGGGLDLVSYANAAAGVTVSLAIAGAQNTGGAGTDTLIGFEKLEGSAFADTLTAAPAGSALFGDAGDDLLVQGAGNDVLNGGPGTDTASYAGAASGVTVSLALTSAQNTGGAGTDTLTGVEKLIGSAFGDTLAAAATGSSLSGGAGADLLVQGAGNDLLDGGAGIDAVSYAGAAAGVHVSLLTSAAQATGGAGTDALIGVEKLIGSNFGDTLTAGGAGSTLYGGAGADDLIGGPGSDLLNGGAGQDFADYSLASAGVVVNLTIAAVQNTQGAGSDQLIGIERLVGSNFNDVLTGDAGVNVLYGQGGADTVSGGAGNDTLYGGTGDDVLNGGAGQDLLTGGAGNDTFVFSGVSDSTPAAPDTITDFAPGDRIDLHLIDANTATGADDAFHLGGGGGHPGDIVVGPFVGGHTILSLYVNADATPDAQIILTGDHTGITAGDFVL